MNLLIVCGPTATGKTSLGIRLAKTFHGEIVNADSRQVYKGLDALTGKERSDEIPIWLYDVAQNEFSVAHFVRLAHDAIAQIAQKGKLPIVVGGTGFYLKALTQPIETISIPPNWSLRAKLDSLTVEQLQRYVDAQKLKRMSDSDRKNPRRLIRAIETAGNHPRPRSPAYHTLWIGLTAPFDVLRQRIIERIQKRFNAAVREVRPGLAPILGADALLNYVRGMCSKEEAIEQWVKAECRYAKRQMTWFRKERQIQWFDVSQEYTHAVEALVREWYTGRV